MDKLRPAFPEGFLFGAATSAYQIEGSAAGGAGSSHWDSFAATPGNTRQAEDGRRACDHYHRWADDLDLVAGAGFDAYRFSTSWARIEPEGDGRVNAEGLDFYDRLVDGLCARGLAPVLTLYHWELPSALAMRGGWTNRDTCYRFAEFTTRVMARLGDRVARTGTINEPWCVAWLSHFLGAHAPGLRDIRAAGHAMHHVLVAHALTLQALRDDGHGDLGIFLNFEPSLPASTAPEDGEAAARQDAIYNRWFLEALTGGGYPDKALEGLAPHLPARWSEDMAMIAAPLDWLGVNYYTRKFHAAAPGPWPATQEIAGPLPKTTMGWEIWPDGLEKLLLRVVGRTGGLPLYVTESGMSRDDRVMEGRIDDAERIAFIEAHLAATRRAIAAGVPVRGFFYWSLLDNYEWAEGYEKRFGLVHVDFETLRRTPKASYHALKDALTR